MCYFEKKLYFFVFSISLILVSCGGGGSSGGESRDTDVPQATVSPATNSYIQGDRAIVITFDSSMDINSLSISGSMVNAGGVWSSVNTVNDTLTISPNTRWAEGAGNLTIGAKDTTRVALATLTLDYTIDDTPPTATPTPLSGSGILNSTQVVILFSETIDTTSLQATKSLWDESDQGVWSTNFIKDDTLTIAPATAWLDGSKELNISVSDLAGNKMLSQSYSYNVDSINPAVSSVTPQNGGALSQSESVTIIFTESLDTNSITVSGSLSDNGNISFSTNSKVDDRITITPKTIWSLGSHTLSLDVSDLFGNALATLNLAYDVGCPAGQTACSGSCVDTSTDRNNCGSCSNLCNLDNTSSDSCVASQCVIDSCLPGFADCNASNSDGCEINLTNDSNNCGSCNAPGCSDGVACTSDACVSSQCRNTANNSFCSSATAWSTCRGSSTCDETGTQSRTVAPGTCSVSGCTPGTSYTETRNCAINTDGTSCGTTTEPKFCLNGSCI